MLVADLMTQNPITVRLDAEVTELVKIFDTTRIHHVIAVEDHHVRGVISDRDVLRCISPYAGTHAETNRDHFTLQKKAHQIMSRKLISVQESASIKDAAQLILENNIGCLPVLRESGTLAGIVSWRDLLHFALNRSH